MKIKIPTIEPREYQLPFLEAFDKGAQYSVISWHRRAGKDVTSFNAMMKRAITTAGNYYYLFPTRAWAQRALWDNICEWADGKKLIDLLCPSEIVRRKNNSDFFLDLINGSRIKIDGTDNLNFVGQGGSGYVLSEFSLHKEEVSGFLAPILTEGNAFVIFNGTLRGKSNHLWRLYENNKENSNWFTQWYQLSDTKTAYWVGSGMDINSELVGKISPYDGKPYKNIQEDVDSGIISYAMARQEYLNEAVSQVENSYYGYELEVLKNEGRFGTFDTRSGCVFTFWDLGTSDATAIIFAQIIDGKPFIIDYHESSGKKIEDYAIVVNSKGYKYGGHFAPHDVSKRMLFGDLVSTAKEVGIDFRRVPKTNSVLQDIEICRRKMRDVYIHERCEDLLEHLESYREGNSGRPVHDNHSHGADAFRTMVMGMHLNIVNQYLGYKNSIQLPKFVGKAESYADWETQIDDKKPLWQTFRQK
jgi:phage terminase large subunit